MGTVSGNQGTGHHILGKGNTILGRRNSTYFYAVCRNDSYLGLGSEQWSVHKQLPYSHSQQEMNFSKFRWYIDFTFFFLL